MKRLIEIDCCEYCEGFRDLSPCTGCGGLLCGRHRWGATLHLPNIGLHVVWLCKDCMAKPLRQLWRELGGNDAILDQEERREV